MAKKRFSVNLDEENQAVVAKHLAALGMTFSGFLNALLGEFAKEIQGQPVLFPDKPMKDLTLEEVGKLTSYWMRALSE